MFPLIPLLVVVLALFIAHSIRRRQKIFRVFRDNNIPGPPPSFLFGNLWEINWNGHLVMQKRWHEQYGPVLGYFYGLFPILLVADNELMKHVMLKDFHKFADRSPIVNLEQFSGFPNSLFVLKGQRWKHVRTILTPSFTSKKLREIMPMMSGCVDGFMENVDKNFKSSAEANLCSLYQALTLDTICKTGMGVDYGVQKDFKNSKALRRVRAILAHKFNMCFVIFASFPILIDLLSLGVSKFVLSIANHFEDPIQAFRRETAEVVKLRRSNQKEFRRPDLLQLMMDAQEENRASTNLGSSMLGDTKQGNAPVDSALDPQRRQEPLTDNELIDNAFLLLLAGYETTSSTLAYLTKMLVRFPEAQERIRVELMEVTNGGSSFDFERLQKCQYTEAFIQETLRMYPPVYLLQARVASEDMRYGKIMIPKGVSVIASVKELQYNEHVFNEPHEFRPERYLPENRTNIMLAHSVPFGSGPRICIGMRFAQMEIKITLAKLLTKYRISSNLEPRHEPFIETAEYPIWQQIANPRNCQLELL